MPDYSGSNERPGARDAIGRMARDLQRNQGMSPEKARAIAHKAALEHDRKNPHPHPKGR